MLRRFNFTDRKTIQKSNVNISIIGDEDEIKSFQAIMDLSSVGVPGDGKVIVEAWYRMMQSQRYEYSTVEKITPPEDTSLGLLGLTENVRFRVIVIDERGKIIASSRAISIKREEKRTSLLPVENNDLDSTLWKVSMEGDEGGPILELNNRIAAIKTVAAQDPRFIHSVYPAVLRQILMKIAVIDNVDMQNPDFDWQSNWILFSERIHVPPPEGMYSDNKEDVLDWIDGVIEAFSKYRKKDWNSKLLEWEP